MTKFLKITLIILLSIAVMFSTALAAFFIITKDAILDPNKLVNPNQTVQIYDEDGNEVTSASISNKHKSVSIDSLSRDTINAFIASEDRVFYSHNGLNYKRMIKAFMKNIASRSFKEGASTISQQLIKNTHLSSDKTIKRKLKEIRLTKQLEKRYSKNEILEMYLNTIYFGHNCYGLQSAAEFYFNKRAENLSLTESAVLVGLLTSPNNYSPFKHPEKSLKRRNMVLKAMLDCGYIDGQTYKNAVNLPLNAVKTSLNGKNSDYINAVFDEIEDLGIDVYSLGSGCKVITYLNGKLQNYIENIDCKCDNSLIITSRTGGVNAYKSTIGNTRRQTGSTIKPLLVYAPAIEEKLVSPFTRILDEKVDFNGYSPENHDKKYHGYVSVTESLAHSYNVPAVKTLNTLTIKKAEKYLNKMNISLESDEKNLSLALGGMKYGLPLKEITDCYTVFSNDGIYSPSRFIKEIVSADGKTIYKHIPSQNRVFSEGTCSLMNEMLLQTSESGTAKKLSSFKFDVAAKTGTCGNENGNTDAYAISYTSTHSIGVWLGDKNNKRLSISSSGDCCELVKNILNVLYSKETPQKLEVNRGTSQVQIDADEYYKNNKIIKADPKAPQLSVLNVKVLSGNEPKETSTKFSAPAIATPQIYVKNNQVNIMLCQTEYYAYLIKRKQNGHFTTIYNGNWQNIITDCPTEGYYTYTVTPYYFDGKNKIYGQEIILPAINLKTETKSPQVKIPKISKSEWYKL